MKRYNHLSYDERVKISELKQSGRPVCTVSRELRRNQATPGQYWPDTAQRLAHSRRRRQTRLDKDIKLQEFVVEHMQNHFWTPEQIAGYLKHRQTKLRPVSHETIYQWIYHGSRRKEKIWKFLTRHKAKRGLRKAKGAGASRIPNRVSIHDRPKHINKKTTFGHWEGDLMSFSKGSQHILVLRERQTMFTLSKQLPSKKADDVAKAVINLLNKIPQNARQSLTLDNGGEFTNHQTWGDELTIQTFFCDPYASWQKGGVENTNGRLRRELPRKISINSYNKDDFDETIDNYNLTPRKKLNWVTPNEEFLKKCHELALRT